MRELTRRGLLTAGADDRHHISSAVVLAHPEQRADVSGRLAAMRGVEVPVLVASGDRVERPGDPFTRCAMKPIPLETLDRELASLAALRARG